ncbi:MAG: glycine betaine ABC transporter substrate-binding protein [Polyangiaceae bacterium]
MNVALAGGLVLALVTAAGEVTADDRVTVGSKAFPESWILGEALTLLARSAGADAAHRANLGGTEIVNAALRAGSIDVYPEYTGTLRDVILHAPGASTEEIRVRLARVGLGVTESLGFDDSYALAVAPRVAERDTLRSLSDLSAHPELRAAFSHEFLGRADGWPGLRAKYGLTLSDVRGVEHALAFDALMANRADVMDVYTTDPEIVRLRLKVLEDDRDFFPRYEAVVVYRLDLETRAPSVLQAWRRIVGRVDRAAIASANAAVVLDGHSAGDAASILVRDALGTALPTVDGGDSRRARAADVVRDLLRHIGLVATALVASVLLGVPLGIAASRRDRLAVLVLGGAGVVQTIPSLALLAFLIPVFGIGVVPATLALFLYALLPIVQGTCTGIAGIPAGLAASAEALGLTRSAKLVRIELPLASPSILAGIRTSAVIAVGTATIAALVGAGGLGDPILEGIALRSTSLILAGAVPCALLALAVNASFALLERALVPPGLRLRTHVE